MSEPILSIRDLKVNYGGIEAVKGISFDVEEGSIVTLIGANGAGKSSTLRTIAGLVKPAPDLSSPPPAKSFSAATISPIATPTSSCARASRWCLRDAAFSPI